MKLFKVFMIVCIVLSLFGCSNKAKNDNLFMNVDRIKNADGSTSIIKNGAEQYFFTVEDGETVKVKMTFDNQNGTIDVYIAKDGVKENADYKGTDIPSSNFSVTISKAGTYQILYTCKDYIGEYSYSIQK
ncbi:MAG: PPC domain-containing protein [Bacilli bacterium]|nr:PPC domain-containing protein [Bacilli bacterium]